MSQTKSISLHVNPILLKHIENTHITNLPKSRSICTSGSWRHAWYVKFEVERSIILCHPISPSLLSRRCNRCAISFSVITSSICEVPELGLLRKVKSTYHVLIHNTDGGDKKKISENLNLMVERNYLWQVVKIVMSLIPKNTELPMLKNYY